MKTRKEIEEHMNKLIKSKLTDVKLDTMIIQFEIYKLGVLLDIRDLLQAHQSKE